MTLSQKDRLAVIERAAQMMVEEVRATLDLEELITLPLDAVGQMVGLGPKQVERVMETRAMGKRKRGVSLKILKAYLDV